MLKIQKIQYALDVSESKFLTYHQIFIVQAAPRKFHGHFYDTLWIYPHPATVTTRIITLLVRESFCKLSFVTAILGEGVDQRYIDILVTMCWDET